MEQYITIAFASAMALLNAIILAKYTRKMKAEEIREARIVAIERELASLKNGLLTEEKFRRILVEELREFELRLINEGRLDPLSCRPKRSGI